ncbi:hypothetical protein [Paenibacillus sp. YIM B09110]|uniref:hypothetical protein n=1 Tax=Paenibacillus sp. YIM B09110 TaxID=3126102 RepID=UPI00301D353E
MNEENTQQKSAKQPVIITQNYALTFNDREYTLQRRHTVDPMRSPWLKPGDDVTIREEWRPAGYYSLTPDGFASAVRSAIVRDVNSVTEARTIAALLAEYKAETERLSVLIESAHKHVSSTQIPHEIGALIVAE